MRQIVKVRQGAEAVDPQAQLLELGPVEPGVRLHPAGRGEPQDDEDEHQQPDAQGPFSRCGSFSVQFGVGQDIILEAHCESVSLTTPHSLCWKSVEANNR